ncbi:MAG: transglycosylase SLT domain-containing protein [Nitrosomonadales bacterium]|nr:transglycosylase SLT domain-containing protein [Nitrosomonadales bacterium]
MLAQSASEGLALRASEETALGTGNPVTLNNPPQAPQSELIELPPATDPVVTPAIATQFDSPSLVPEAMLTRNDLWQRIRNGYAIPSLDSPLIARHEQWYADRPDYVARMTERAQRYLFYIVEEVEKRGMPTEIALLPMIESAYNPTAYSISRASGIWQFIPATGKTYGLQQNWWYDGRRDIVSATRSALDYLQKLHDQFGDWQLALAAYNWGEGSVERAQEHNRRRGLPTDYASLKMPDETRNYVPKLLAVKNIISSPEKFDLALQPIPNQPYFTVVTTTHPIDVKLAAKLAGISQDEFSALNPAHNRPVILQENAETLLLPVDNAETFRANLESYNEPLVSWQAYQSKKGERLDKLAPRFGLSLAKLKSINGLSQRSKLSNGQALLVPLNGEEADSEFEAFNTHLLPGDDAPSKHTLSYTVHKGETLNQIARRYHVSVATLKNSNNGISKLKPGQTLNIVQASKSHRLARAAGRHHVRLARTKDKGQLKLVSVRGKKQIARKAQRHTHVASR